MAWNDENQTPSSAELAYYIALISMLGVIGFYCVELARFEYFGIDDWLLLHEARQPEFSWIDSFLPFESRRHWAFRPIGEQTFYRLAYQAFGLDATGYFSFSLLTVCLTGWVSYGLSRSLGMLRSSSWAVSVLTLTALPTLSTLWNACLFTHILAQFCIALTVWLFIEGIQRGSSRWISFSTIPFAIGLLSYEATLVVPIVLVAFALVIEDAGSIADRLKRCFRRISPHAAVAALYILLRLLLAGSHVASASMYESNFEMIRLAFKIHTQILGLTDGPMRLAFLGAFAGTICLWIRKDSAAKPVLLTRLLPILAVCCLWSVLILIPMLVFSPFAPRFSIFIELPVALAAGLFIDSALRRASPQQYSYAIIAVGVFIGLAIPWASLTKRFDYARERFPSQIRRAVEAHSEIIPDRSQLILMYGTEGLATDLDMDQFRRVSYGYTLMFWNFAPHKNLEVTTHSLKSAFTADLVCENCIHMTIDKHLHGSFLDREQLDQLLLKQGLATDDPEAWASVFAKRFDLGDKQLANEALSFCRRRGQSRAAIRACRKKISGRLRSRNDPEARRLSRQIRPAGLGAPSNRARETLPLE